MLRFLADENFNNDILRGLLRQTPDVDIVRVQDIMGLSGADDPTVLAWAAREDRVLLTHDVTTLTDDAYRRVTFGQTMPGVFAVGRTVPIGHAIEDILLLAECSLEGEWEGQVLLPPLIVMTRAAAGISDNLERICPPLLRCRRDRHGACRNATRSFRTPHMYVSASLRQPMSKGSATLYFV